MPLYLALIYEDEEGWRKRGPEAEAGTAAHRAFGEKYADVIVNGQPLKSASTARSIRSSPDGVIVTDGPWSEAKEVLGGYYLFEAPDDEAALAIAEEVPAPFGGVELRPVMPF